MRILFAVCSMGLGHSTRSLPLIEELAKTHDVTVLSCGRPLKLLKKELKHTVRYINYPETHMFTCDPAAFFKAVYYFGNILKEYNFTKKLIKKYKYQLIISDCRYGVCNSQVPSFFITHQLRIMSPDRNNKLLEDSLQFFNSIMGTNYVKFLVPDFADSPTLTGDLSHDIKYIEKDKIAYIGPISSFEKRDLKQDVDYLFVCSGPEPYRTQFEDTIIRSLKDTPLKGNITIVRSRIGSKGRKTHGNIRIIDYANEDEMCDLINQSKIIITRSGYTTIMDLSVIGKKALFVPTPLQTEQEYLADYHNKLKTFYSVTQDKLNLASDIRLAEKCNGFKRKCNTEEAIKNFVSALKPYL